MAALSFEKIGPTQFKLAGELDLAAATDLSRILERDLPPDGDVTFDLSEVLFMDSAAIGVFAKVARLREGRGRMVLVSPTRAVRLALEMVRLDVRENIVIVDRLG